MEEEEERNLLTMQLKNVRKNRLFKIVFLRRFLFFNFFLFKNPGPFPPFAYPFHQFTAPLNIFIAKNNVVSTDVYYLCNRYVYTTQRAQRACTVVVDVDQYENYTSVVPPCSAYI